MGSSTQVHDSVSASCSKSYAPVNMLFNILKSVSECRCYLCVAVTVLSTLPRIAESLNLTDGHSKVV